MTTLIYIYIHTIYNIYTFYYSHLYMLVRVPRKMCLYRGNAKYTYIQHFPIHFSGGLSLLSLNIWNRYTIQYSNIICKNE